MLYWLENAIKSALGNPPPARASKSWLDSARGALGSRRSSLVLDLLHDVPTPSRIMVSGLDAAGKTTLMHLHVSREPKGADIETRIPFIGVNFEEARYHDLGLSFHAFDVGGCSKFSWRMIERAACEAGDALVWVVDAWDWDRSVEVVEEISRVMGSYSDTEGIFKRQHSFKKAPMLILLNKQKLENPYIWDKDYPINKEWMAPRLEKVFDQMKEKPWSIHETDFVTGHGVAEGFKWLSMALKGEAGSDADHLSKYSTETELEKPRS